MDIEQLKEMVNSTIVENGKQEITGASLNLALNSIIDSISEIASNSSSGAGVTAVGVTTTSMDELTNPTSNLDIVAANIEVFNKAHESYLNGGSTFTHVYFDGGIIDGSGTRPGIGPG